MNKIEWTLKAFKQLRKVAKDRQKTIVAAVSSLDRWPETANVKKLTNHNYPYRLRVGHYRVFFSVRQGEVTIIRIEEVKKRDNRTY